MWNLLSRRNKQRDSLSLQDMPEEIVLKIFTYLEIKNILKMCQTSKRYHEICQEDSLWQIFDYSGKKVPTDFVKKLLEKGCTFLCLQTAAKLKGNLDFNDVSKLTELYLDNIKAKAGVLEQILTSSRSLKVLELRNMKLNPNFKKICQQNGKTLQILDLTDYQGLDFQSIQHIVRNCTELIDLSLYDTEISEEAINYLANNLTPKIRKLNLACFGANHIRDEHITTLVSRCNNIVDLDISYSLTDNDSITSIIEHLKPSLRKLNVNHTFVDCSKLSELKVMPRLKILNCEHLQYREILSLRQQLPHVQISSWKERANSRKNNIFNRFDQIMSSLNYRI